MESLTTSASIGVDTYWSTCRAPKSSSVEQAVKISGQKMELVDASSIQEQDRKNVVTNFKEALATEYGNQVASLVSADLTENTKLTPSLVREIIGKAETQDAVGYAQMARGNRDIAHKMLKEAEGEYQGLQHEVEQALTGEHSNALLNSSLQSAQSWIGQMQTEVTATDQAVQQAEQELQKPSPDARKIETYAKQTKSYLGRIAGFFSFFTEAIQQAKARLSSILNQLFTPNLSIFDTASVALLAQQQQQTRQDSIPTGDATGRQSSTINPIVQLGSLIDLEEDGVGEKRYGAQTSKARPVIDKLKQAASQAGGAAATTANQLTSRMQSKINDLASTGKKFGGRLINAGDIALQQEVTALAAATSDVIGQAGEQVRKMGSSGFQKLKDADEKKHTRLQNSGVRKVTFSPTAQETQTGEDERSIDNPMLTEATIKRAQTDFKKEAAKAAKLASSTMRADQDEVPNPILQDAK